MCVMCVYVREYICPPPSLNNRFVRLSAVLLHRHNQTSESRDPPLKKERRISTLFIASFFWEMIYPLGITMSSKVQMLSYQLLLIISESITVIISSLQTRISRMFGSRLVDENNASWYIYTISHKFSDQSVSILPRIYHCRLDYLIKLGLLKDWTTGNYFVKYRIVVRT